MTTLMTLTRPPAQNRRCESIEIRSAALTRATEHFLTVRPLPGESPEQTLERMSDAIAQRGLTVLKQTLFASREAHAALPTQRCPEWPRTQVDGAGCAGGGLAGVIAHCVSGAEVERVRIDGRVVGSVFEDGAARFAVLAGILPADTGADRSAQARSALRQIEAAVEAAGMDLTDVARTWLFVDRILEWYDALNEVRTRFFRERDLFSGLVPASTGVGAANPWGAALTCEALAVTGADVSALPSPLQCSARDYGSSFSRAVEIETAGVRRLLVSGTASIAPDGRTLHVGDCAAQICRTFDVVEALLQSRSLSFGDVTRAIAYFRHTADAPMLADYLKARDLPAFPVVVAQADICRDDLLFEIELDAVSPG